MISGEATNYNDSHTYIVGKVKDLKDLTPNLDIDWLKIINDFMFDSDSVTEDDVIHLYGPILLNASSQFLETVDKG